jgi:hypothetical protein
MYVPNIQKHDSCFQQLDDPFFLALPKGSQHDERGQQFCCNEHEVVSHDEGSIVEQNDQQTRLLHLSLQFRSLILEHWYLLLMDQLPNLLLMNLQR